MPTTATRDRVRSLIDVLIQSLDDPGRGDDLARRAYLSRFHFDRLVAAGLGEAPAGFRRRLLLERAAYELAAHGTAVIEAAIGAGYASPAAFARAFRRAFGVSPSRFRGDFRLPAPNGVHFHPPGGLLVPAGIERSKTMDLTDRMLEHDLWLTGRLLDAAGELPEPQLDEPVPTPTEPRHAWFEDGDPTLRTMLDRLVYSKEIWTAALAGRDQPERGGTSIDELRERHERSGEEFARAVRDIRDRNAWDTAFVDALCDSPETFTFGGMVAHVLTWSAHRRQVIVGALRNLGADVGTGDPIEWERRAA
ncbi:MAG TPA: AraC family transcriptional regulator [Gaiellaceae bacterium]